MFTPSQFCGSWDRTMNPLAFRDFNCMKRKSSNHDIFLVIFFFIGFVWFNGICLSVTVTGEIRTCPRCIREDPYASRTTLPIRNWLSEIGLDQGVCFNRRKNNLPEKRLLIGFKNMLKSIYFLYFNFCMAVKP